MNTRHVSAAAILATLAGSALGQSTDPFSAQFQLSGLLPANGGNGSDGFVLNGIDSNDYSGVSVSSAGDINGDGIDDLILGAFAAAPNGISYAGESYVVFGAPGVGSGGSVNLSTLSGSNGFVINGVNAADFSGSTVCSAGDVNGDGIDDLIIGAYQADPNGNTSAGESYVVFGAPGVGGGGSLNLSALNGSNGFVLNGIDMYDYSGQSVSSAGDVNGDGIDDLIIGAFVADPNGNDSAGESYVVFGAVGLGASGSVNLSSINGSNGFVLNGIDTYDRSGRSVSSAGDVNGDGVDDLIIGAVGADPNGNYSAGESYVVFGARGVGAAGSVSLSALSGSNGFVINGIDPYDRSGRAVSSAGDVNGDGIDDLLIAAYSANPNGMPYAGESYVVFGAVGVGSGGSLDLSSLNGSNGFVLNGIDSGDFSGRSVSSAGDVNGDGIDDLVIGAYYADPGGNSNAGESYVVFGGPGVGVGGSVNLSSLNGSTGFVLSGIDEYDLSGRSVSSAGDVNGDGIGDLIIGAAGADPNGISGAGESYVVFGRANANVWTSPISGNWDWAGNWRSPFAPIAGRTMIVPPIGVTVTGPTGAVFMETLEIGAGAGRTTLDLRSSSLVSVAGAFNLASSAALTGGGTFAAQDTFTNAGLVAMDGMSLLAPNGVINTASGTIESADGFLDGSLTTAGVVDLSGLFLPTATARLDVTGVVTIDPTGHLLMRHGIAELNALSDVTSLGRISVTSATAVVLGSIVNDDNGFDSGLISISAASDMLVSDDLVNAGSIVLTSDSSLIVLGTLYGNGVSGGGSVFAGGGIDPGLPGPPPGSFSTARFDGDVSVGSNARTVIEIGGTAPGIDLDQISSASNIGVGGTLEVVLTNGYVPQPGDVYQVLDFITATGSFSSIVLDPALTAAGADTSDLLINGTIFIEVSCPADMNGDGILDNGDIGTFVAFFLGGDFAADMNGDGFLDNGDIGTFIAAFLAGC